jgi:phage tail tape-measure protein
MTLRNGRQVLEYQLAGAEVVFENSTVSFAQGGSVGVVEASAAGSAEGVTSGLAEGVVWVIGGLLRWEWG